jgi:hypothetical protein
MNDAGGRQEADWLAIGLACRASRETSKACRYPHMFRRAKRWKPAQDSLGSDRHCPVIGLAAAKTVFLNSALERSEKISHIAP